MGGKKDPGKFTVRFNLCDPQQRKAAELLNRQGRSKAQFITNAVLHYAVGDQIPGIPPMDDEQIKHLVENILAQRQDRSNEKTSAVPGAPTGNDALNDAERRVIFETLDAFQQM